jgi:hypothetical protein
MINVCACMGPQGNDPECPCKMKELGLQSSVWTQEQIDIINQEAKEMLSKIKQSRFSDKGYSESTKEKYEAAKQRREDRREIKSSLGYSRVGMWGRK